MGFKRIRGLKALPESSLWFELPNATNAMMHAAFGTGLSTQDRCKYSDAIVVQSDVTGVRYDLYKCYGQWRVGALGYSNDPLRGTPNYIADRRELERMFG